MTMFPIEAIATGLPAVPETWWGKLGSIILTGFFLALWWRVLAYLGQFRAVRLVVWGAVALVFGFLGWVFLIP